MVDLIWANTQTEEGNPNLTVLKKTPMHRKSGAKMRPHYSREVLVFPVAQASQGLLTRHLLHGILASLLAQEGREVPW